MGRTAQQNRPSVLGCLVVWLVSAPDGYLLHKRTVPLCSSFEFRAIRGNFIPISIIYNFYGRLLTFELSATDKFTLVVNDKRTFNFMLERPPVNLRANLYVMLIDLESRRIIKEEKISEY